MESVKVCLGRVRREQRATEKPGRWEITERIAVGWMGKGE